MKNKAAIESTSTAHHRALITDHSALGTQTVIDHIRAATPKGHLNRRRTSRTQRCLNISAGILIGVAVITFLSSK